MTVALATRGMIRRCCKQDQIVSRTSPETQAVLEVRPRIRLAGAPPVAAVPVPVQLSAEELRPETQSATAPVTTAADAPTQTSAQELKPVIKKVTEE